jgi:uncharacterized protein (DUF2126 family)
MTKKPLNKSRAAQRVALLEHLKKHGSITTLQARQVLGVMSPAPRIKELRVDGYSIITIRVIDIDSAGIKHRQGLYILCVTKKESAQQ